MKRSLFLFLLTGFLAVHAGVNLKNGNFYVSYTDIVVPGGGKKLEITRTYNSKATEVGWFGFGWGSEFETKLSVSADGSVVIHEHGSGAKTRFVPKTAVDVDSAAKKIVEAMRKKSALTEKTEKDLIAKLKNNAELRHMYAKNFGVTTQLAAGTVLYSNDRGMQEVVKEKDGFVRKFNDGRQEHYSEEGKIVSVQEKDGYKISFEYKDKTLISIKDNKAKQIFFSWYPNGLVKELWSAGDRKAEFKYDNRNLVYSKDIAGFEYGYDYDKNHNMVKVDYAPNKKKDEPADEMLMKYDPKTFFVTEVMDRNGESTHYNYGSDPKRPQDHYWTEVSKKNNGDLISKNKYEYEIKTKPDGQRYTYRTSTEINGIKTETIYSECCSLPLKIARGKDVTTFEYNKDGLLTKKSSTKGDFVNLEYDEKLKKITKVVNNEGWTQFSYDGKGNLQKAVNSQGKAVMLFWDYQGKITKMSDMDKNTKEQRTLSFVYNSLGKPVEINLDKVGKINVDYDNYGEIKKVDSKGGYKMATQVFGAFQNLADMVKPSGVNLNM